MFLAAVRLALVALGRAGGRSALTALGILIGVAAVAIVTALGQGASQAIGGSIQSLGTNVVYVFNQAVAKSGARTARSRGLTLADARAVQREVPSLSAVTVYSSIRGQVQSSVSNTETDLVGGDTDYFDVRGFSFESGRPWSAAEERARAKVIVLGSTARDKLFGAVDPMGETVRIGKHPFRVIGTLSPKGPSPFGGDQDNRIMMPIGSWKTRVAGQLDDGVGIIMGSAKTPGHAGTAERQIEALLRQRHRIGDGQDADFIVRTQQQFLETQEQILGVLQLLLLSVAAVALFVGGVGVMNIMLVNVTERRQEIGIRMAIGARARDIQMQFLTEAILLTLFGGGLGVLLAFGIIVWVRRALDWSMSLSSEAVAASLLTSLIVGVVFGFLPARRAAQLDPMESLRHE